MAERNMAIPIDYSAGTRYGRAEAIAHRSSYGDPTDHVRPHTEVFRPNEGDIIVSSGRELAMAGIHLHPDAVRRYWGSDGLKEYQEAMRERRVASVNAAEAIK